MLTLLLLAVATGVAAMGDAVAASDDDVILEGVYMGDISLAGLFIFIMAVHPFSKGYYI